MKRIKCEWCGHHYNLDKYENCPKCGATNSNLYNELEQNLFEKFSIYFKKLEKKKKIIFISISFIVLFAFSFFIFDKFYFFSYMIQTLFQKSEYACYYLVNPIDIKAGDGIFYIDSFSCSKEYSSEESILLQFDLAVDSCDFDNHIIDFYLYQEDKKYRVQADNFPSEININSINEIYKNSGTLEFSAYVSLNDDNNNLFDFNKIELVVDNQSYFFDLILKDSIFYEKYRYGKDGVSSYNVSDRIVCENGNIFYINNLETHISTGYSSLSFSISNYLNDYSSQNLKIFLKDSNCILHRALEPLDFFDVNISCLNDLLIKDVEYSFIHLELGAMEEEYKSLIFDIDGEVYEIDIESN